MKAGVFVFLIIAVSTTPAAEPNAQRCSVGVCGGSDKEGRGRDGVSEARRAELEVGYLRQWHQTLLRA